MPKRVNFAFASPAQIANLALNSALKHSLDNINGTTLGTVKYILHKTKSVNLFKYSSLIEDTLATAVADGKLLLDDSGWYTWPNHEHHFRLRRERLERQRQMIARSAEVTTSLPDSATGSQGIAMSSPNSAERLNSKRKRNSKRRADSSSDVLPNDSVITSSQGQSLLSTHSLKNNVNGQQSEITEAEVTVAGGSNLAVSNQDSPLANKNPELGGKKKKRNKGKRSKTQHNEDKTREAKKHSDTRFHKGNRFKKN